jgi:gliding motility-associated-like protein
VVKDDFGCDTAFTVEVDLVISQLIEAIAGDGYTCIGNATVVPLKLNNFLDILSFNVKLTYDTAILSCDGFIQLHPLLEENILVSIVPATDEIIVSWQGDSPLSLEENATMLELVFGAKYEGFSTVDWAALPGESVFYNGQLDEVNADYHVGSLRIYTRPEIFIPDDRQVCEGEFLLMTPFVNGGTGEVSYFWEGPNGFESTGSFVEFEHISKTDAGSYLITVTDTIDCVESAEVKVTVFDNPQIAFREQDTIFDQPGFILDAGSGYQNYLWNTGDTTNAITIDIEGLYSVLITSSTSCKSTDSVTVLWEQSAFYLPNAFSPNGDGLNDEFKAVQKYDFVNTYHMQIYNRWGEMIFETSDINRGWDGTFEGKPSPQGSYVYKIIYTAWPNKNEQQLETGVVTLVR